MTSGTAGGQATYFGDTLDGAGSLALDWDHDGKMDVLEAPSPGVNASVTLYTNLGAGAFSSGTSISSVVIDRYSGIS
ncbi:hypothetical protein, partial [Mesorhizobium japonicum]|uniref:hypothetical protein n=1 Tax=Mesorhizobium japonicum TaxID=2066070 RepID=UPI003B5C1A6F